MGWSNTLYLVVAKMLNLVKLVVRLFNRATKGNSHEKGTRAIEQANTLSG